MGDAGDSQVKHAISDPSPIPQAHPVKLEYDTSQCASYVSQRSSSIETFGSHSPTEGTEDKVSVQGKQNIISSTAGSGEASEDQQCIRNDESMPSSLLNPAHQSTPLKDCTYMSTPADETGESLPAENSLAVEEHEVFLPGDLQTPILGYETMEARSRFTVYKIQVQKQTSDSSSWFVFRRYSDFLHLNERLRHLFPGFRLSLPPKRWFRDNFDQNFLEDRVLGLQTFLNNIIGHKDICNSAPVRGFLCTDEPPGPHDSLEESRAFCDTLEESVYALHQQLQDKQIEIDLLKEQVSLLSDQVRVLKGMLPAEGNDSKASSINGRSVRVTAVPRVPTPIEVLLKSDIPNTESQEQSRSSGVDEEKKEVLVSLEPTE